MNTFSDELLAIARRCADELTFSKRQAVPALEDIEDQCEDGIEELLAVLQDEDVFGNVDLAAQQEVIDRLEAALPEQDRALLDELTDLHTRHVWLQQEAAYHLGLAIGMKLARVKSDGSREADSVLRQEAEDDPDIGALMPGEDGEDEGEE